jgi:PAS domain S-box-containing protein
LDITDVKAAEERVKKSEKLLNAAQQIAKLGSWEVDMETGEVMWSEEMYRIFDFKEGDEKKNYEFMRKYIHRDDVQYMNSIIKILERKPQDMEIHYRIVTPDGRLKYLNSEIRIQHDENLKPIRIYGSTQDITEIKLVEDELRNANARLLQAQKELIHNEKLAALGRFSSGIAHEIRNPLANISALTQLLSKTKLDEKSEKHLKYILVNTDIANKIIVNLLNFASPEELILKQESVSEILNSMIESVEPRCIENKVKIGKCIPDNLPLLRIDRVKLENAFMNFISNAIDAMPEGGEINVEVKENKTENQLVIRISDTGSGIAKENLDKIFEPFFTTKEQGTGLGLGLAYQTVRLHFGIINISSEPGLGTIVEIKLPINELSINGKNINN